MIDAPRVEAASLEAWRDWLAANHARAATIWLVTFKRGHAAYLAYEDARDEALCWGWIDSRAARLDAERTMTLMSRRRPGSPWSAINRARVAALNAGARMAAPGLAAVARARRDGSWDRLAIADDPDTVPADLALALAAAPPGAWLALPRSRRRSLLEGLALAASPATRARRVAAAAASASVAAGRGAA